MRSALETESCTPAPAYALSGAPATPRVRALGPSAASRAATTASRLPIEVPLVRMPLLPAGNPTSSLNQPTTARST